MRKVIVLALLIISFSVTCFGPDGFLSSGRTVVNTSTIPSEFEAGQSIWAIVEFTIQNSEAVFNRILVREQEGVEFDTYGDRVLKDLGNGYTTIRIHVFIRIKEPAYYHLDFLGINYSIGGAEYKYMMRGIDILVYPSVRIEASIPVETICLGYPLLYEAQITTEHEVEIECSQEVVYKQIAKTDYGYLAKLWLSYAKPGKYGVIPMRAIYRREIYYPSPIQIVVVPFRADLFFSSRAVKVGEPLDFTIEIKPLGEGYEIERHLSSWGKFEVDNLRIDDGENYKISGSLKLFEMAGNEYLLGPIGFQYIHDGKTDVFYLPAIPIHLQKTVTSDAYVLKGLQYGRDLNMPIWNFVVLGLLFIVVLVIIIKIVRFVCSGKPEKEKGISYQQKLTDALREEDWVAMACLIKQIIGEDRGLTAEESLSLTVEECNADGPALKILEAVDKKLFADEPIDLTYKQISDEFPYLLDHLSNLWLIHLVV